MLVHPRPMCPRPKILGCCIPWTKCPLAILPLTEPSHPFELILCVGRACIRRRGANPIRGVGEAGQTPHWSIRCRRPTEAAKAADGASCMLDAVQGRDTSVRGIIFKGRFVPGAQHPRTFGRGHINPASKVVGNEKGEGVGRLATVWRWFQTMEIDVCLLFNVAIVFSSMYFRFLLVKPVNRRLVWKQALRTEMFGPLLFLNCFVLPTNRWCETIIVIFLCTCATDHVFVAPLVMAPGASVR